MLTPHAGKYHICDIASKSGIARYADDFFRVVLKQDGFTQLFPQQICSSWLTNVSKDAIFHIELGSSRFAEAEALRCLIKNGFKNVDVTIHDAPWVTFPYYHSRFSVINQMSKAFDWFLNTAGATGRLLARCRRVYTLTLRGKALLEQRHHLTNVCHIPHVIDQNKIWREPLGGDGGDILYFGFIGANKGLEYALAVHAAIRASNPGIRMQVIGQAVNRTSQRYLDRLQAMYPDGVEYTGFVPETDLDELFARAGHVFLPFGAYKYWCPCSGSILHALRRGRIVWTNRVNAIDEIIQDGGNGLFFSGDVARDAEKFESIRSRPSDIERISLAALATCQKMHDELKLKFFG